MRGRVNKRCIVPQGKEDIPEGNEGNLSQGNVRECTRGERGGGQGGVRGGGGELY